MTDDLLESFEARYPFPLDDFQHRAIVAIRAGQSVIVSAPTGAGKTLIAEFAIHAALERGRRIAYTTPLKALSNQKYADFSRQFGSDQVGILTGDVKVNPSAPVLVMTHPGYYDGDLAYSRYGRQRDAELAGLSDPRAREVIERHGIRLAHFGNF